MHQQRTLHDDEISELFCCMRARSHRAHADDALTSPKLDTPGASAIPCDAGELAAHRAVLGWRGGAAPASPLRPGSEIDELFGLPPVLPLRVKWRCEAAGANSLDVRSADGLAGVATDCRMDFSIAADGDASVVDLAMSYEPASPLALLAAPVLVVDNWLALNVLLPRAFSGSPLVRQRDVPGLVFFALLSTWHFGVGPAIRDAVLAARGG